MTLEKAIEILNLHTHFAYKGQNRDLLDAIKLGLEALKWIARVRQLFHSRVISLLPGETA